MTGATAMKNSSAKPLGPRPMVSEVRPPDRDLLALHRLGE